jgi:5-methylcytosine-specific restriction endonuclease McrA/thiamine phosphate synthase YjbQ (UPF0047 family)
LLGEVDRISSSGNAIVCREDIKLVSREDVKPLSMTELPALSNHEINLGPLPSETVGEDILFIYSGGTFSLCIDTRHIDRDYIQEMSGRVEFELARPSVGIPEITDLADALSSNNLVPVNSPTDAETQKEVTVQVIARGSSDAIAVSDKYFVVIPESSVVSPGDQLRVSPSDSSDNDFPTATVSARPIFQDAEMAQLIRLPNTRADVVHTNGTPVVVDHLPDVDSTVTLGVSEINEDHIVPSISALPKSHTPNKEDYVLMEIDNASSGITAGTSEELPITSLLPPEEQSGNAVTAQVLGYSQSVIWVASDDIEEYIEEDIGNLYRYLQQADSALCQRKYQDVIQHLDKAIKSCPSSSVLERLLMIQKTMARAMISIKNNSKLTDIADAVSSEAKQLREFDERQETTSAITALLLARKAEMEATERFLTGLSQAPDDVNKEVLSCRLAIREGIESLKRAKGHAAKTPFEQQTPSSAVWLVTQEFQDSLPLSLIQETQEFETIFPANSFQDNDTDWLQHVFSRGVSHINIIANNGSVNSDTNTWHRPATPEKMGITHMTETGDDKNAHIESAQNSDSETPITEQTSTSRDDSEGGTETTSAGGTSSGTPTTETNETETQTEPESSTGPTSSTGESPTTNLPKLQELRRRAERESSENPEREDVSSSTTTTSRYKRSSAVREYALARADGTCEACKKDAPFIKENGDPYLEVHHVNELSDGGADDPSIVGAVCPSCHKEIHYGKHGDELNEKLRERLQDGLGDVGVVDE